MEIERKYLSDRKNKPTEEEAAIQQKAHEIRSNRNSDIKELSKKFTYKNPVFTIIKIAILILPLIFAIVTVNNITNMDTTEFYEKYGVLYISPDTTNHEIKKLSYTEILATDSIDTAFLKALEHYENLTPEQREILMNIGNMEFSNTEDFGAFLIESGLYDIVFYSEPEEPTLEELMKEQEEEIKKNEHLMDGIWGN